MEEAIREGISGPAVGGNGIDVAALVAHSRPLGVDELLALLDGDRDILDTAEEAVTRSAVTTAISAAMLGVDRQLEPLVGDEGRGLYRRRGDLGGDAELVTGAERLALGLVLGAAWQYRATLGALHEWLISGGLADPGRHTPIDHRAALTAAYQVVDEEYEQLLEELKGAQGPAADPVEPA